MRCLYSARSSSSTSIIAKIILTATFNFAMLSTYAESKTAMSNQEKTCSLLGPEIQAKSDSKVLIINIRCRPGNKIQRRFQLKKKYVLGLTLYALDEQKLSANDGSPLSSITNRLNEVSAGESQMEKQGVKFTVVQKEGRSVPRDRFMINDDKYSGTIFTKRPLDIAPIEFVIDQKEDLKTFSFAVDTSRAEGYDYFLFAVWPAAQKNPCDKSEREARSGCKDLGFVIGDDGGSRPVDFYPGTAVITTPAGDTMPMWVVEKF